MPSRILTEKEANTRRKLSSKISILEDQLNMAIAEAYKTNLRPDVSVDIRWDVKRPVIKVNYFRDDDAIQSG